MPNLEFSNFAVTNVCESYSPQNSPPPKFPLNVSEYSLRELRYSAHHVLFQANEFKKNTK